jgi:hypothetical protein
VNASLKVSARKSGQYAVQSQCHDIQHDSTPRNDTRHNNTEHYDITIIDAEFQYTLTVIISIVILESVILLSVITLTVIMLNFIILIDIVHLC